MRIQTSPTISSLRKTLLDLCGGSPSELAVFLSSDPLVKGTVYTLRRKCFKPTCRCARGERHETIVLTASVNGKKRLWSLPEDRREEIQQGAENYRRFRKARAQWIRERRWRQKEILGVMDALARARLRWP